MQQTCLSIRMTFIALCLAALAAGCQSARMPLPDSLASTEHLAVHGRNGVKIKERLAFGPFEARSIDRSWTRGIGLTAVPLELSRRKQTYAFDLHEDGAMRWRTACEIRLYSNIVDPGPVDLVLVDQSTLTCNFNAPGGRWTLTLTGEYEQPLSGILAGGRTALHVSGTRGLRGGLPAETTTGYTILQAGRSVAAVEVLGNGAVWMDTASSEDPTLLAALAAALLLAEDLHSYLRSGSVAT